MNSSTVTLNPNTVNSNTVRRSTAFVAVQPAPRQGKPVTVAQIGHTLARKWDMIGVVALMLSSAAYGVYALTCLTGF